MAPRPVTETPRPTTAWSYSGQTGPSNWAGLGYSQCDGASQSPVDLAGYKRDENLGAFTLGGTAAPGDWSLTNNGHSAQLSIPAGLTVSGGGLPTTYNSVQLHFHWGSAAAKGSEHTIDGQRYPIELHIVNADPAKGDAAAQQAEGLAVLGVMYKIGAENQALKPLTDALAQIQSSGSSTTIAPIKLTDLLPDTENYLRYSGSLTTPDCYESVIWTVFKTPMEISEAQLAAFRSLKDSEGADMVDNYRPLQNLNGREIRASPGAVGAANGLKNGYIAIATVVALALALMF